MNMLKPEHPDELRDEFGYWREHPNYPAKDWRYEVSNEETKESYWDWVFNKIHDEYGESNNE
jgi:hypothetical protein